MDSLLTRNDLLSTAKLPQFLNDVPMKKAIEVLNVMNFTIKEHEAYENHLKWFRIEASGLKKKIGGKRKRLGEKSKPSTWLSSRTKYLLCMDNQRDRKNLR